MSLKLRRLKFQSGYSDKKNMQICELDDEKYYDYNYDPKAVCNTRWTEKQIFVVIKNHVSDHPKVFFIKGLRQFSNYSIKAVNAHYRSFKLLPQSEQTSEVSLHAIDSYFSQIKTYSPDVLPLPLVMSSITSTSLESSIRELIKKQRMLDTLSGQDNLIRIFSNLQSCLNKLIPYLDDENSVEVGLKQLRDNLGCKDNE